MGGIGERNLKYSAGDTINMSTNTTNLSLVKQTGSEYYSIDVVNANLDKIDAGCVNVSQAQTITGDKTFAPSSTGAVTCVAEGNQNNKRPIYRVKMTSLPNGSNPASGIWSGLQFTNANDAEVGSVTFNRSTNGLSNIHLYVKNTGGTATSFKVNNGDSTAYMTGPYRTYNASYTGDIVTIGSLQSSTDVVHTSGNESIGGTKTFTYQVWLNNTLRCCPTGNIRRGMVTLIANSTSESFFIGQHNDNGNLIFNYVPSSNLVLLDIDKTGITKLPNQRTYSASNTTDVVTIGTLQGSTDVVHTAGNETIAGDKTLTGVTYFKRSNYANIYLENMGADITNPGGEHLFSITARDKNGVALCAIRMGYDSAGLCSIGLYVRNADGTSKYSTLLKGDP